MKDIKNYKHEFYIDGMKVVLLINRKRGYWDCDIIEGKTGIGHCRGGKYLTLDDYIVSMVKEHTYAYHFFNHGYKVAKEKVKND